MKTLLTISIVLLLGGCSKIQPKAAVPTTRAQVAENESLYEVHARLVKEHVHGYVLLSKLALEYSSAARARAETSPAKGVFRIEPDRLDYHAPPAPEKDRFYHWGSPLIFREVVADHGDIVEVNTTLQDLPESLGHGGKGADYRYQLRTFLRKKDLVPVLKTTVKNEFDDGTSITLFPGVAVGIPWSGVPEQRAVSVQQLHFPADVPDASVALSYVPELKHSATPPRAPMLRDKVALNLNGMLWGSSSEIRVTRLRTPIRSQKHGEALLVTLGANGIELNVIVEDDSLVAPYEPTIDRPILTKQFKVPPRWFYRIPAGTKIYWEDGRVAGKTRMFTGKQSENPPRGSMWGEVYTEMMRKEPICFRLEDIEVIDNEGQ